MTEAGDDILSLRRVTRQFGTFRAVDGISLDIRRGEIFSLLGPSGCGKSTTLRLIAGLDQPDRGEIALNGSLLASPETGAFVPTQKRNMGMVFQSYAIWPHLSVFDTVAYPLAVRKIGKQEIGERVARMLRLVGLEGFADRPAPTLSGGQQQRIALARALIYEPDVLLLDEPFSNLDIKLREQMRLELKLLQRRVGVTVILVTHDQIEALSISDRIAIMKSGRIEQLGSPIDLYEHPATAYARDFIGASLLLSGKLLSVAPDCAEIELPGGNRLKGRRAPGATLHAGDAAVASIRPESLVVASPDGAGRANFIAATTTALLFVGDRFECVLDVDGTEIRTFLPRGQGQAPYAEGRRIGLDLPAESVTIWPP